jgi:3D (Asp-Asp-Asp) domain-containing protein
MGRQRKKRRKSKWLMILVAIALVWGLQESRFYFPKHVRPPKGTVPVTVEMETTSYCHCRRCCSYKWMLFIPYQKRGMFKYRIKHVGITSSGAMTRPGTIAADTSIYPYGTVMHIPGYGYGRVEDTGGAIKGHHIDLYRPNHWFARHWGVRTKKVRIWLPDRPVLESGIEPEPSAEEAMEISVPVEPAPEEFLDPSREEPSGGSNEG